MLFIFSFICSDVIVVPSLSIFTFNVTDFLPSGIWSPLYSSTNSTSLTFALIFSSICFHVISSSTMIDKSFSTNGSSGNLSYSFVLEAYGTNFSVLISNIATFVLFILVSAITFTETNPNVPITSLPLTTFRYALTSAQYGFSIFSNLSSSIWQYSAIFSITPFAS